MKNIVKFLFFSVIFIGVSGPAMAEDTPVPAVVETETETETEIVVLGQIVTSAPKIMHPLTKKSTYCI